MRKEANKAALSGRRFIINTLVTQATVNSTLTLEAANGLLNARLDFEDFLGFQRKIALPSFDFQYSLTRHSAVYAEYYPIFRNNTYDVTGEFEFGDITVPIDAGEIRAFINTQIWSVGYMYSFINEANAKLSFFANIFFLGVETGIDVDKENITRRFNITAPLPSFGYKFSYEILPKLRFNGSHSFFFLEIGGFGGTINNLKLSTDYRFTPWLSIGLAYSVFVLNISSESERLTGIIEYEYKGPGIYAQFVF